MAHTFHISLCDMTISTGTETGAASLHWCHLLWNLLRVICCRHKALPPIRLSTANGKLGLLEHLIWLKVEDDARAILLVCASGHSIPLQVKMKRKGKEMKAMYRGYLSFERPGLEP